MNKVSDYHGFYLKTVVLLLADAFENIFLALLKDITKQIINACNQIIIVIYQVNISHMQMQIIYMFWQ